MRRRFEQAPDPRLRAFVRAYWGIFSDDTIPAFTVTPDRFVELVVFSIAPRIRTEGSDRKLPVAFVVPLLDRAIELVFHEPVRCAAIRLYEHGAVLGGTTIDGTPCAAIPAEFAAAVPLVVDALRRNAWLEITRTFDRALLECGSFGPYGATAEAVAREFAARGADDDASVHDLALRTGKSRRQVERSIRALTKRSSRQLAALARFHHVRDVLWADPARPLSDLALEAGYTDQSHFSREFRRYTGMSPTAFKRYGGSNVRSADTDVALVQDTTSPQALD